MAWTKQQQIGIAVAITALALLSGGAAGFILGSQHQKHTAQKTGLLTTAKQDTGSSVPESDVDDEETANALTPSNGRHAGTRFLAARREQAEAPKKETPAVSNVATNTNTTVTAAAETGATPRSRRSRRTP